jgi:hypothetical protein
MGCVALATICALLGVPGFKPFTDLLVQFYGFYGYSVSSAGIVIGAFWGLIEGFVPSVFSLGSTTCSWELADPSIVFNRARRPPHERLRRRH